MKTLNNKKIQTISIKTMRVLCAASFAMAFGCMEQRPDRDYVDTNVVEKALFEGEWYHAHTIIDNDQESTWAFAFRGSVSFDQTNSVIGTIARVRFVIDEDWLYAYRSYPVVADADRTPDGGRDMDIFEPMAAWNVESHFDIVHRYNTETGERLNVIEENDQDRPWYERQYMRVDWGSNDITGGYNFNDIDVWDPTGVMFRDPAGTFVQEGSEFPEHWQPLYSFTPNGEPEHTSWEWEYWDRYGPDQLYHFSFVSQEIWSTGAYMLLYDWARPHWILQNEEAPMSALMVTVRHSFLRVPDEPQYEPMPMADHEWEQFGAWRIEQPTYTWGDLPDEDGGFTNFYGQTDALNYWVGRHNIWRRSFEIDEEGRRQSIPYADREIQPVVYTLSEHFPAWLIHTSFDLIGEWNGSMMESVRVARGEALPETLIDGSSCDSDEDCLREFGDVFPFTSCRTNYSGSSRQCSRHYNPFSQPGSEHHMESDFDCHIETVDGSAPVDPGIDLGTFDDERLADQRSWRFVGEECVLTLRNNTCDDPVALAAAIERRPACEGNPELCCDQMGDLRFNFLAHNDQVGLFFGGVSQPLMDPLTGELIQANANAAGLSVEGAMTYVGWYFDLVDGDSDAVDELSMMVGEDVRALMENSNYAIPPVTPSVPPRLSTDEVPLAGMSGSSFGGYDGPDDARAAMQSFMPRLRTSLERAEDLQGREGRMRIFSERLQNLEGTRFERMLHSGPDGIQTLGYEPQDPVGMPSEAQLDRGSVFRNGFFPVEREYSNLQQRMARRNFYPAADDQVEAFMDNSYVNWLNQFPDDTTPQQRAIAVGRSYFRSMMLHEMGHSVGMRHNFAGSLDYDNYHDQYYNIEDEIPLPSSTEYDLDEDGMLDYTELGRYNGDLRSAREERELAGVARWHNASIMEYMPRISNDLAPLGRYDRGFVNFVYGNSIEVYTEAPNEGVMIEESSRNWLDRPDRTPRSHEMYFAGGETCRIDINTDTRLIERYHHEDCPLGVVWYDPDEWPRRQRDACERDSDCDRFGDFSCDTERGWCVSDALPEGQVVGQRCAENPRAGQTEHPEDLPGVCLGYRDSWTLYTDEVVADTEVFPVQYRFCSDERTNDISWCSRFDEGENFREVMNHYRERWVRSYPFSNFRRFRANFGGANNFSTFADIAKVMSHFYYRYFYENLYEVTGDVWIDSITDHLAGAAAGMNFMAEVISQPDVGSYEYNPDTDAYEIVASGETGLSEISIEPGQGRYMWSSYQEGPFGVFRMERSGSYNDKMYALWALSIRDWGMTYNYDERFWINFYSMFPYEMSQLFGGLILDNPTYYGARVCEEGQDNPITGQRCDQTTILYQDLWRGSSFDDVDALRGNPYDDIYADMPAIGGANSEMLRSWAVIFSLAEFPIFYDTTYEQQLYLFVEGTGDSFDIRDCDDYPDDEYCLNEGDDYVRYFSDRFNFNVVSFWVEPEYSWEPESVNTSFSLVNMANELQNNIEACEENLPSCPVSAGPARDAALEEWGHQLEQTESFIIAIMDIQGEYGIASWL